MNKKILFLLFSLSLLSCQKTPRAGNVSKDQVSLNAPSSLPANHGRVLLDSPLIVSKNNNLGSDVSLGTFVSSKPVFITDKTQLVAPCRDVTACFEVRQTNEQSAYTAPINGRWGFNPSSLEFLEVNTFFHTKKMIDKFFSDLVVIYQLAAPTLPLAQNYQTAFPSDFFTNTSFRYWLGGKTLKTFSSCSENNAYFDPANFLICLGNIDKDLPVAYASDPSVVYHEIGHALVKTLLNMNNVSALSMRSDLGYFFYDEAGSINEGIADYLTSTLTKRTRIGEWALGRFFEPGLARPLSEDDSLHAPGIAPDELSRLSYPEYLAYDANTPDEPFEDVHNAGQITSHFLSAFRAFSEEHCALARNQAEQLTLFILAETLAYVGNLSSSGPYYTAGNPTGTTLEWQRKNRSIDMRFFLQRFGEVALTMSQKRSLCKGSGIAKDDFEKLVDQYGLLLFDRYTNSSSISLANRQKSETIEKQYLEMRPTSATKQTLFVFDKQKDIQTTLRSMLRSGKIAPLSPLIPSTFGLNNGNGKLSPGEVAGVAFDLFNNSNSLMGGVQILANPWQNHKLGVPCYRENEETFPTDANGAIPCDLVGSTRIEDQNLNPVCLILKNTDDAQVWVKQSEFKEEGAYPDNFCLDEPASGTSTFNSCFVRVIDGADVANYSLIRPQKYWSESVTKENESTRFHPGNLLFFELSPWIPPGTQFACRLRARFTNCRDCWDDTALPIRYDGSDLYQRFDFFFTVTD
jgi:hypothetical protein